MSIRPASEFIAEAQKQINCVSAQEAKNLFDQQPDGIILDVREASSAEKSKLQASVNVSRGLIEMKVPGICENPDQLILTHCAGGGRASLAAARLVEMGYRNVHAITARYDDIKAIFG